MSTPPSKSMRPMPVPPPNRTERLRRLEQMAAEDLKRMSPEARLLFLEDLVPEMAEELPKLLAVDYVREPVSLETFIYDPEYLGQSLRNEIYPALVDDLIELFEGDYIEVVLGGGIGWGKTRLMEVGLSYEIYQLSCLKNPAKTFGLIPGSTLALVNVSVDKRQAYRVLFSGLYGLIERSPYFREIFPYDRNLKSELHFLRQNITAYPATASEQAVLGEGVFSASFDEMNFMARVERSKRSIPGDGNIYDQAEVVANKLYDRISSRFNQRGKLPGHLWYASSARFPNDFTERKEGEARTNARIFVRRRTVYETKPRHTFMTETFKVEVGDISTRTRVLDGTETDIVGEVLEIPKDFEPAFGKDPEKSVRDIAGRSVLSITPFIARREMIRKMFIQGTAAGLKHPFSRVDQQGQPLDVTLQGARGESEFIVPEHLHYIEKQKVDAWDCPLFEDARRTRPVMERRLFPTLYYAHVDLAKGQRDKCGLVIAHAVGTKPVPRLNSTTMKRVMETMPVTRVDLALRIVAPPRGEVDIPRIRALFHQLRQLGMEFGRITFDQYQSQESIKALRDAGFTADLFSVDDENATAYEMLKQALYDERVLCYEHPKLEEELAGLERTPRKVDHPSVAGSSKDLADCLAAAVHHSEEGWRKGEGSRGMFQLGIVERPGQVAGPSPLAQEASSTKVVTGGPLTAEDLCRLVLGHLDKP